MPIYEYMCNKCSIEVEIEQALKEKPKKKCPSCKKMGLERLISRTLGFIADRVNTIGQLAERNTKKLGRYEKESFIKDDIISGKLEIDKDKREQKEKMMKLATLNKEQQEKYIMTGKAHGI